MSATENDPEFDLMYNGSLATEKNDRNVGVPMTLKSQCVTQLETSNGDKLYDKILTGFKPVFFPTACSENCCFEYRFSMKDLILPTQLPQITNLYFRDLVVKMQDLFTQITAEEGIKDSIICSYAPFSAVLAQDQDGIEIEYHDYNGQKTPFITSDRVTQRDSSPLFVVSSNLKYTKKFNLEINSNSYQAIIVQGLYEKGELKKRILQTQTYATPLQLKQALTFYNEEEEETERDGLYCMDIILCDMLIFNLKSFDFSKMKLEDLTPEKVLGNKRKRTVPFNWLSQEEKLKVFGKKGTLKGSYGNGEPLPTSLFIYVDMTAKSEEIFEQARPTKAFFYDDKGLICPAKNCYAIVNMMLSVRSAGDR